MIKQSSSSNGIGCTPVNTCKRHRTHYFSVYVAGGSSERLTHCRMAIEALRDAGVIVTHDWTVCEGYDRPSADVERATWARQDIDWVCRADIVWYVAPQNSSEGSSAELGAALALDKRLIVSGPHALRESRIFTLLGEHYRTHAEALRVIVEAARAAERHPGGEPDTAALDTTMVVVGITTRADVAPLESPKGYSE